MDSEWLVPISFVAGAIARLLNHLMKQKQREQG